MRFAARGLIVLFAAVQPPANDPRQFLLYEQYRSPRGLAVHRATAYYKKYAAGGLQTIAESRTAGEFTPL